LVQKRVIQKQLAETKNAAVNAAAPSQPIDIGNTKAGNDFSSRSRTWNRLHCFGGEYVVCVVSGRLAVAKNGWEFSQGTAPRESLNASENPAKACPRLTLYKCLTIAPPPSPYIVR
jgi:hypothetical protein